MKNVAGIMLIAYVSAAVVTLELGAKGVIDADTVRAVQSTLDVPIVLVLVVFVGLSIRLEIFKPKYRLPAKKRPLYDSMLFIAGAFVMAGFFFLKYG